MAEPVSYDLKDYDYAYPEELIAPAPAEPRDSARLLVLRRSTGEVEHRAFRDLPRFLRAGDCLVLNRTKVLPARLLGRKPTGGKVEVLLVLEQPSGEWTALSADLKPGMQILFPDGARAETLGLTPDGQWRLRFSDPDVRGLMRRHGLAPLPHYIVKRRKRLSSGAETAASGGPCAPEAAGSGTSPADLARYQTVYAAADGSIAAPTAGLHFTPGLLAEIRALGVSVAELVLHVGMGTFRPVNAEDIREHVMLPERYEMPAEAFAAIRAARADGGRIVAVGTTAVRTLEHTAATGELSGSTGLFIRPGREFRSVDVLVTNFHQPRSTPLLLACAFAGRERLLAAYREAVAERYRLFSYGDSMLIL